MENLPTAEEFLNDIRYVTYSLDEKLITFARLHVEAALAQASYNAKLASYDNKANKFNSS